MLRATLLSLFLTVAAFAQAPADPIQALVAEVHQLRMDLQTTTITTQRVQILLYRVQLQQASAARAATSADEAHARLSNAQQTRAKIAQEVQQEQEWVEHPNPGADPTQVKQMQVQLTGDKQKLEMWQNEEQQWQARDIEAQSQLRAEQAKLNELQDALDKLDKALAKLAGQ